METTEVYENIGPDLRRAQKCGGIKTMPTEYLNLTTLQSLILFTRNSIILVSLRCPKKQYI